MNENAKKEIVENPEPDWSFPMFWEDITAIIKRIFELIKSFFDSYT